MNLIIYIYIICKGPFSNIKYNINLAPPPWDAPSAKNNYLNFIYQYENIDINV